MTDSQRPSARIPSAHSISPRRALRRSLTVGAMISAAAVLAACASPTPEAVSTPSATPTPTPTVYPAQPAFEASPTDPAEDTPTASPTVSSLTADLSGAGESLDLSALLNASQGGYGPMRNTHWLAAQAATMAEIGVKEIRVDHIFDDATYQVVNGSGSNITYDFTRLDKVLLPLAENGLTPFISLSYMPASLGKKLYGPPSSSDAWGAAVAATVAHYRDLGYTGWSWEVWNEIDTMHWTGTDAQYAAMYAASAAGVRSADPTALVGGSAASELNFAGSWSSNFIKYIGANPSVPIDFFSYHSYRTGEWDTVPMAREWLEAAGKGDLPIYITEWNNDSHMERGAGQGSDTNSSVDGSSYLARRLFLAIDGGADKYFYFSPVEGLRFNYAYNGDLGLITADGHRKSSGNVFAMYSALQSTRVDTDISGAGSGTEDVYGLVTKNPAASTSTALLWNNTAEDTTMTVTLDGLPYEETDTNFRVTQRVVSTAKGNGYSDLSTAVSPVYPSANENAPVVSDVVSLPADSYTEQIVVPAHGVVSVSLSETDEDDGQLVVTGQPATVNLAAAASGAAVSSSSSDEDAKLGLGVAKLIDGHRHSFEFSDNPLRGWASESHSTPTATESVTVDLAAPKPVDTVVLWPRDAAPVDGTSFPVDFTIQGSTDNATWTTLSAITGYNGGQPVDGAQTFGFTPGEYQYIKVEATTLSPGDDSSFSFQLAEIQAFRLGIVDGRFESGTLDAWTVEGDATVVGGSVHSGAGSVKLASQGSSVSQLITGLVPNTTYTFGGYIRAGVAAGQVSVGVSGFGLDDVTATSRAKHWSPLWVTFTTGPDATSATVDFSVDTGISYAWGDDFTLTQQVE